MIRLTQLWCVEPRGYSTAHSHSLPCPCPLRLGPGPGLPDASHAARHLRCRLRTKSLAGLAPQAGLGSDTEHHQAGAHAEHLQAGPGSGTEHHQAGTHTEHPQAGLGSDSEHHQA